MEARLKEALSGKEVSIGSGAGYHCTEKSQIEGGLLEIFRVWFTEWLWDLVWNRN